MFYFIQNLSIISSTLMVIDKTFMENQTKYNLM